MIIFFFLCVCLLPSPPSLLSLSSSFVGQELFTVDDIRIMHDAGVKVQLDEKIPPFVLPADTAPSELIKVKLLDFSDSSLYRIPPWLKRFTNLRSLNLSKNHLDADSDLLETLQAMPKLEVLNLSGNPLFVGEAAAQSLAPLWQRLSNLEELYLSGTQGTAKNFASLSPLRLLKILDISHNQIGNEIIALELNKLAGLQQLNLSSNSLKEIPYIEMNSLEILDLRNNDAVRLAGDYGDPFSLKSIKRLKYSGSSELPEGLKKKLKNHAEKQRELDCSNGHFEIGQYIDNCDGTITDTKTGLMWKRCSEGLSGVNCEDGEIERYSWDNAVQKFNNVEYAAYKDWRLPTIDELKTLIYSSDDSDPPVINQQAFPNTVTFSYWSGSPGADDESDFTWHVNFFQGNSYADYRYNGYAVRLVRGGHSEQKEESPATQP